MEGNLQWDLKNYSLEGKVRHIEVRLERCFSFVPQILMVPQNSFELWKVRNKESLLYML